MGQQAVKHQPATPLPWCVSKDAKLRIVKPIPSKNDTIATGEMVGDTCYIAHAANAYPKLVGALRHLLNANCATCPTAEAATEARALARHVLRELGEAA